MPERMCLLDKLKSGDADPYNCVLKCNKILEQFSYSFNDSYLESPYALMGKDIEDAIDSLIDHKVIDAEVFLDYYEFIKTILYIHSINYSNDETFSKQVNNILDNELSKCGFCARFDEEKQSYVCYRKNLKAEIIASRVSDSVKTQVYNYLSLREGDLESKRSVLKSLIDNIDTFCKSNDSIKEISKAKHFYQCIRHPKDEPCREFPFFYEHEEKWMDYIFEIIVDVLAFKDLKERVKNIINEEKKTTEGK